MDVISARNRLANVTKYRPEDTEALENARQDLSAAHLRRAIEEHARDLSPRRRAALAGLLRKGGKA